MFKLIKDERVFNMPRMMFIVLTGRQQINNIYLLDRYYILFFFLVFIISIVGVSWYHFYLRWKSGRPSSFAYKNGFALLPQKPYLFDDDDEVELFRNPVIKGEFTIPNLTFSWNFTLVIFILKLFMFFNWLNIFYCC